MGEYSNAQYLFFLPTDILTGGTGALFCDYI